MIQTILAAATLLAAAPTSAEEAKFRRSAERFDDAAACQAKMKWIVEVARKNGVDVARGPYEIAPGDVRMHTVRAEGAGHLIWEYRCLAEQLSSRYWHHAMEQGEEEFSIESVARNAEWLKKDAPKQ